MTPKSTPSTSPGKVKALQAKITNLEEDTRLLLAAERRARDEQRSMSQQLEVLRKVYDLGRILGAARTPAAVVKESIEFVVREFAYEAGAILLLDAGRKTISAAAVAGQMDPRPRIFELADLGKRGSVLWETLDRNAPILVEDGERPDDPARVFDLDRYVVVPLVVERAVPVGVLLVGSTIERGAYYRKMDDRDGALLSTVAGQIALMLQKEELHEHLQKEKEELERAQLELRTVNERLEERVREKTRALRISFEKLEESRLQLEAYSRDLEGQVEERTRRLRESEQKYRSVMASSNAGMAVYRGDVILEINPALTEIVGQPLEGCPLSVFVDKIRDPVRREELWQCLKQPALRTEGAQRNFEVLAQSEDGERGWNVSVFILDSENDLYGFLVVDTTEARRVEQQLFGSQKMASLGNLAGGIAHEFNNILVGILGNASLLRTRVPEDSDMIGPAEMIEVSALRAADLVQQLLGFARKGKYRSESLDLNNVVRETLELARRSFDRRIEIVVDLDSNACLVEGDGTQLQQVIMNLSLNARDAMPQGGRLTARTRSYASTEESERRIPGLPAGQWVRVEIEDTGSGMDEDTRRRMFEPFFSTKETGSAGLGLPMVYGIVTNHGGAVHVESAIGKGTKIVVHLPAAVAKPRPSRARRADAGSCKGHILVVDDEEILRRMCHDALSELGYDVHVEEDGDGALEYCSSDAPVDLVILDLGMPKMSGEETHRRLMRQRPGLKVVICTGTTTEFTEENVEAVLVKPFTFGDLKACLEKALGAPETADA